MLGARHGVDPDHLAAIDGISRFNAAVRPRLARFAGALFSVGHGVIVVAAALAVSIIGQAWQTPRWLETSGSAVSIITLFAMGLLNAMAIATTPYAEPVSLVGLRSRLFLRFAAVRHPASVVAIGALFALSFDTISQAALFGLAAKHLGGAVQALLVSGCFFLGMLLTDGANGLWITRLLRQADQRAAMASRILATTVAALSFAIGSLWLAKLGVPVLSTWLDDHQIILTLSMLGVIVAAYGASILRSGKRAPV
jgi:high-affinity nickel-transport protein